MSQVPGKLLLPDADFELFAVLGRSSTSQWVASPSSGDTILPQDSDSDVPNIIDQQLRSNLTSAARSTAALRGKPQEGTTSRVSTVTSVNGILRRLQAKFQFARDTTAPEDDGSTMSRLRTASGIKHRDAVTNSRPPSPSRRYGPSAPLPHSNERRHSLHRSPLGEPIIHQHGAAEFLSRPYRNSTPSTTQTNPTHAATFRQPLAPSTLANSVLQALQLAPPSANASHSHLGGSSAVFLQRTSDVTLRHHANPVQQVGARSSAGSRRNSTSTVPPAITDTHIHWPYDVPVLHSAEYASRHQARVPSVLDGSSDAAADTVPGPSRDGDSWSKIGHLAEPPARQRSQPHQPQHQADVSGRYEQAGQLTASLTQMLDSFWNQQAPGGQGAEPARLGRQYPSGTAPAGETPGGVAKQLQFGEASGAPCDRRWDHSSPTMGLVVQTHRRNTAQRSTVDESWRDVPPTQPQDREIRFEPSGHLSSSTGLDVKGFADAWEDGADGARNDVTGGRDNGEDERASDALLHYLRVKFQRARQRRLLYHMLHAWRQQGSAAQQRQELPAGPIVGGPRTPAHSAAASGGGGHLSRQGVRPSVATLVGHAAPRSASSSASSSPTRSLPPTEPGLMSYTRHDDQSSGQHDRRDGDRHEWQDEGRRWDDGPRYDGRRDERRRRDDAHTVDLDGWREAAELVLQNEREGDRTRPSLAQRGSRSGDSRRVLQTTGRAGSAAVKGTKGHVEAQQPGRLAGGTTHEARRPSSLDIPIGRTGDPFRLRPGSAGSNHKTHVGDVATATDQHVACAGVSGSTGSTGARAPHSGALPPRPRAGGTSAVLPPSAPAAAVAFDDMRGMIRRMEQQLLQDVAERDGGWDNERDAGRDRVSWRDLDGSHSGGGSASSAGGGVGEDARLRRGHPSVNAAGAEVEESGGLRRHVQLMMQTRADRHLERRNGGSLPGSSSDVERRGGGGAGAGSRRVQSAGGTSPSPLAVTTGRTPPPSKPPWLPAPRTSSDGSSSGHRQQQLHVPPASPPAGQRGPLAKSHQRPPPPPSATRRADDEENEYDAPAAFGLRHDDSLASRIQELEWQLTSELVELDGELSRVRRPSLRLLKGGSGGRR